MKHSDQERTLAFAGLIQACSLVDNVASHGMADVEPLDASLNSLFLMNPETTEDVYGGVNGVMHGIMKLRDFLGGQHKSMQAVARYSISLMQLERRLAKNPSALLSIGERLDKLERQRDEHAVHDPAITKELAAIYSDVVSPLGQKILVGGEPVYLQNDDNVFKIRALLLAGIRSAMLWRQCGGSKWGLLFGRKKMVVICSELVRRHSH